MIIETEPCKDCDFSPEYCSCDIDICQITRGDSKPVSSEEYEAEKLKRYQRIELGSRWDERVYRGYFSSPFSSPKNLII